MKGVKSKTPVKCEWKVQVEVFFFYSYDTSQLNMADILHQDPYIIPEKSRKYIQYKKQESEKPFIFICICTKG